MIGNFRSDIIEAETTIENSQVAFNLIAEEDIIIQEKRTQDLLQAAKD
jgi:hypothetical protein